MPTKTTTPGERLSERAEALDQMAEEDQQHAWLRALRAADYDQLQRLQERTSQVVTAYGERREEVVDRLAAARSYFADYAEELADEFDDQVLDRLSRIATTVAERTAARDDAVAAVDQALAEFEQVAAEADWTARLATLTDLQARAIAAAKTRRFILAHHLGTVFDATDTGADPLSPDELRAQLDQAWLNVDAALDNRTNAEVELRTAEASLQELLSIEHSTGAPIARAAATEPQPPATDATDVSEPSGTTSTTQADLTGPPTQSGVAEVDTTSVVIAFTREDREPDPEDDHSYGTTVDDAIYELTGVPREQLAPTFEAVLREGALRIELHETGPLIVVALEQLPEVLTVLSGLVAAWWSSRRDRKVRIDVAGNIYEGTVKDVDELQAIIALLDRPH